MRLRRRKRVKAPDDGMTHVYVGPTTVWGLRKGTRCKRSSGQGRGGLIAIRDVDGKVWNVLRGQVQPL